MTFPQGQIIIAPLLSLYLYRYYRLARSSGSPGVATLDTHPNHQVVGAAALMAYKHSSRVWGKEDQPQQPADPGWNLYFYEVSNMTRWEDVETMAVEPNLYLDVGKVRQLKKKAVDCFQSQADYQLWEVQDHMHRQRGEECGVEHAEAFVLLEAKPGCPLLPVSFLKGK